MRSLWILVLLLLFAPGCAIGDPRFEPSGNPVYLNYKNPLFVPSCEPDLIWEAICDVIHDYFRIAREEPVRQLGGSFSEGRLETHPEIASTILEPWRHDSADTYEKIECTLQTERRFAEVRVFPGQGGFWIDVAVFKELEDVRQPTHSTSGAAVFRHEPQPPQAMGVIGEQEIRKGWIPKGRDPVLEQRILAQLSERFGLGVPAVAPMRIGAGRD